MTIASKGLFITASGVLIMSFESLFIRLTDVSSLVFSFYLGFFMFFSTFIMVYFTQKDVMKKTFNKNSKYILLAAILMGVPNIFFISAIKNTSVANVVIILSTSPLFSAFFSFLLYRKKPSKNIYIASFFIFVGLFVIFKEQVILGGMIGNFYALLCTLIFSYFFVILEKHKDVNRYILTSISGLSLAIISFILNPNIQISLINLAVIAAMGLLITPISRVMIGNGTKYISASEVGLLMVIETIMAPVWVWIFLKEIPASSTFLGGIIIVLTLILNSIYTIKKSA